VYEHTQKNLGWYDLLDTAQQTNRTIIIVYSLVNLEVWGRIDSTNYGWANSTQFWTGGSAQSGDFDWITFAGG
jgi:hypothetical protein